MKCWVDAELSEVEIRCGALAIGPNPKCGTSECVRDYEILSNPPRAEAIRQELTVRAELTMLEGLTPRDGAISVRDLVGKLDTGVK